AIAREEHRLRVRRPREDGVVGGMEGQLLRGPSLGRHDEDVQAAGAVARKRDPLAVGREARVDVARLVDRQAADVLAVLVRGPDVADVRERDLSRTVMRVASQPGFGGAAEGRLDERGEGDDDQGGGRQEHAAESRHGVTSLGGFRSRIVARLGVLRILGRLYHARMTRLPVTLVACALLTTLGRAQPVFTGTEIFPPDEFAARRLKVMAQIGDAVAVLQGTTERPGEQAFRQNNQFFYLTGVVEPRAIAVIDGRTKETAVFLQPYNERRETRMFGPALHPGDDAAHTIGVNSVVNREAFAAVVASLTKEGRTIYTPFRPEVLGEASSSD